MKKIFWTTIFWFLIIFLFWSYLRLFDKPLGREIGNRFGKCPVCVNDSNVMTWLNEQLDAIKSQLDTLTNQLQAEPWSRSEYTLFQTTAPTKVALYYFNQTADQKLPPDQQVNINSILPVYRIFPPSKNLLVDTINELLKWNLTESEKANGFVTEFPHPQFKLLGAEFIPDGTLTLSFPEVSWFTDGWSARMFILSSLIEKTALQFPGVRKVVFVPDTLFQP